MPPFRLKDAVVLLPIDWRPVLANSSVPPVLMVVADAQLNELLALEESDSVPALMIVAPVYVQPEVLPEPPERVKTLVLVSLVKLPLPEITPAMICVALLL